VRRKYFRGKASDGRPAIEGEQIVCHGVSRGLSYPREWEFSPRTLANGATDWITAVAALTWEAQFSYQQTACSRLTNP